MGRWVGQKRVQKIGYPLWTAQNEGPLSGETRIKKFHDCKQWQNYKNSKNVITLKKDMISMKRYDIKE